MAHNIFGERFYGHRQPAWHGLGIVSDKVLTPTQAVNAAKLDYEIHLVPAYGNIGDTMISLPNSFVLMREPTEDSPEWAQLSKNLVSDSYTFMQNKEWSKQLKRVHDRFPLETVGALGNGETIFFTFKGDSFDVNGEQVDHYFLVTDTRTGGHSATMALTPIRVVCQNTLTTGLRSAQQKIEIQHGSSHKSEVLDYAKIFSSVETGQNRLQQAFQLLADRKLDQEEYEQLLREAYPAPKAPSKLFFADQIRATGSEEQVEKVDEIEKLFTWRQDRQAVYREAVDELFGTFNDEFPQSAGSAWAFYNAVVEAEDYRKGNGNVQQSALFGPRAATKKRAFAAAMKLTK
jgi:phage/plasmid-like protein (TIGR03299 family)